MNKDSDVWRITVHPFATDDMHRLKASNPEAFKSMMKALKTLAVHGDVFSIDKPFDICYSFPHARDCLRFKERGQVWRVVLRLIVDGVQVRPETHHRPADGYLQVVFVDERSAQTYHVELVARWAGII